MSNEKTWMVRGEFTLGVAGCDSEQEARAKAHELIASLCGSRPDDCATYECQTRTVEICDGDPFEWTRNDMKSWADLRISEEGPPGLGGEDRPQDRRECANAVDGR